MEENFEYRYVIGITNNTERDFSIALCVSDNKELTFNLFNKVKSLNLFDKLVIYTYKFDMNNEVDARILKTVFDAYSEYSIIEDGELKVLGCIFGFIDLGRCIVEKITD